MGSNVCISATERQTVENAVIKLAVAILDLKVRTKCNDETDIKNSFRCPYTIVDIVMAAGNHFGF